MSETIDRLVAWLEDAGGSVGPVVIRDDNGDRTAWSTRAITQGERILCVPRSLVLAEADAASWSPARLVAALWPGPGRAQLVLAAGLARPDPAWAPYTDTLPASLAAHPLLWEDLSELHGTLLLDLLEARRHVLLQEHAWLRAAIPPLATLSAEEWLRARALVSSRTFAVDRDGNEALVPFADLFDHAPGGAVSWRCDEDAFELFAKAAIPADAPLHIDYGPKQNVRLFLYYGFVLPDNPVEGVVLDLGTNGRFSLTRDAGSLEMTEMLAMIHPDHGTARALLAETCRARLAGLPDGEARPIVRILREEERRILTFWAEGGGSRLSS